LTPDKDPVPVADIQPSELVSELGTRVAVLQKKAAQERVTLPADVALFIAATIRSNEQEGALIRLVTHSSLVGAKITLPYTQQVLKNFVDSQARITGESSREVLKNLINRLARYNFESIQKDPLPMLLGYARNVLREYRSEIIRFDEKRDPNDEVTRVTDAGVEVRTQCLEICLQRLDDDDRQLLREYHKYEPGLKIEHRKAMANARQSTLNAIRLKVSRLMSNLRNCVKGCCRSRGLEVQ